MLVANNANILLNGSTCFPHSWDIPTQLHCKWSQKKIDGTLFFNRVTM